MLTIYAVIFSWLLFLKLLELFGAIVAILGLIVIVKVGKFVDLGDACRDDF